MQFKASFSTYATNLTNTCFLFLIFSCFFARMLAKSAICMAKPDIVRYSTLALTTLIR